MFDELRRMNCYLERPGATFDFGLDKWGVVLLNMGGPDSLSAVRPYLQNIFSDPAMVKFPLSNLIQRPLAKMIAALRAPASVKRYAAIGGSSPLPKWTALMAIGMRRVLSEKYPQVRVYSGMRYSRPFIAEALDQAVSDGCRHLVLLSLYPQYCQVTTGTALREVQRWLNISRQDITVSVIGKWHDQTGYIELLRGRIEKAMKSMNNPSTKLIFSAHAIPQTLVVSGDPYLSQIEKTVNLAGEGYNYLLAFQSRSGPIKWTKPEVLTVIKKVAAEGTTDIVIVPVSFVCDHLETLFDIDIQLKRAALSAGIQRFMRTESFNDDPVFIRFLSTLICEKIKKG